MGCLFLRSFRSLRLLDAPICLVGNSNWINTRRQVDKTDVSLDGCTRPVLSCSGLWQLDLVTRSWDTESSHLAVG